jgi:glutathione S-transferase
MTTAVPKASIYWFAGSVWATVPLLTIEEKGYGPDEIDLKVVDLSKGENFAPSFLRLNPKGTVPTLVAPLDKTLHADMEVRYKALTDSVEIVNFLDKSRSAFSHTHTTSSAPAPSLAPATVAFATTSKTVIDLLHSDEADPNRLFFLAARDDAELAVAGPNILGFTVGRRDALTNLLADAEREDGFHASEKTNQYWTQKKASEEPFLEVSQDYAKPSASLSPAALEKRNKYYKEAKKAWEVELKNALQALSKEIVGPYVLGDQVSVADMHLAAWIARVGALVGANPTDTGAIAIAKIEAKIGGGFTLPKDFGAQADTQRTPTAGAEAVSPTQTSKLAAFWDAFSQRPSWKKWYGEGLH